jgi:transposase
VPLPPPSPPTKDEELARLRRENERLRMERDFLKKAAAFFAKESQ